MKRTTPNLSPSICLAVIVGCSGLLAGTPQRVSARHIESVLLVTQSDELSEAERLNQQVIQLYQQGKYNEAIPIAERVLEIRVRDLGENHPDVANILDKLAELYIDGFKEERYTPGQWYSKAESFYRRSLAIREKALGKNHPDVAKSLDNLGLLYRTRRRYKLAALALFQRSLAIRENVLGEDHPNVAKSLDNLGLFYSHPFYSRED